MKPNLKLDRKRGRRARCGLRYWVVAAGTMGALVAYSVGHSRAVTLAYVRDAGGAAPAARRQAQTPAPTRFDIAPGTAQLWLVPGCASGTDPVAYRAPPPIVRTITAGEVITLDTQLIEVRAGNCLPEDPCTCQ